jgi:putative nucleotidyltransferase with HDIG domain
VSPKELISENQRLKDEVVRLRGISQQLQDQFDKDRHDNLRQIDSLRLMFEVAGSIAASLDLKELLPTIMAGATRVLNAEASSLILVDEETGELFFEVALGERSRETQRIRMKKSKGIAGWVLDNAKTLLVPDVSKDPRHARDVAKSIGFAVKSILCSPLRQAGKVIGVVEVLNKKGSEGPSFSEDDIPLFEAFADQSATAISKARAYGELAELSANTIRAFAATLDARDPYTYGHSERVTEFSLAIADEIGLCEEDRHHLKNAALLHDVGKIGVPDAILLKAGRLTDAEYEVMKQHPVIGYNIVSSVKQLRKSLAGIRHHHERIDGLGYPDRLKGNEIPLQGRILAVADFFDALTSTRAYRERFGTARVRQIMEEVKGSFHDPDLVDALFAAYEKGLVIEQSRRTETERGVRLEGSLG